MIFIYKVKHEIFNNIALQCVLHLEKHTIHGCAILSAIMISAQQSQVEILSLVIH